MICRSVRTCVGRSVYPVHCGKTVDRIRMPFGIVDRMGPGMRQVVGFGIGPREGVLLAANLGCAIVTSGDLHSQRRGPLPKLLWADLLELSRDFSPMNSPTAAKSAWRNSTVNCRFLLSSSLRNWTPPRGTTGDLLQYGRWWSENRVDLIGPKRRNGIHLVAWWPINAASVARPRQPDDHRRWQQCGWSLCLSPTPPQPVAMWSIFDRRRTGLGASVLASNKDLKHGSYELSAADSCRCCGIR